MVGVYESDDEEDSCEVTLEGVAMDVLVVVGRARAACSDFLVQFPSLVIDEDDVDENGKPNKEYRVEVEVNGHVLLDLGMDYQTPWCVFRNKNHSEESSTTKPTPWQLENQLLLAHDDAMRPIVQWGQPNQLVYRLIETSPRGDAQGVVRGYARGASLYIWSDTDRIIVSDIDGTVTSSDLLSVTHTVVMERYRDSFHSNVHDFFSSLVDRGGVRIVYLSTRPVSLLGTTRRLLATPIARPTTNAASVVRLPDGPFFCNLQSLARVLFMELVTKTSDQFKADVLQRNIVDVFREASGVHDQPNLWVAGFGNKGNDAKAYQTVGIDHVYIIDTSSKIVRYGYKPCHETLSSAVEEATAERTPRSLSPCPSKRIAEDTETSTRRVQEEEKKCDSEWIYQANDKTPHNNNLQVHSFQWCCLPPPPQKSTLSLPASDSLYTTMANLPLDRGVDLFNKIGGKGNPIFLSSVDDDSVFSAAPPSRQRLRRRRASPPTTINDDTAEEETMVESKVVSEKDANESSKLLKGESGTPQRIMEATYEGYGDEKLRQALLATLLR